MKKILLSLTLLLAACFVKAQQPDSVMAKLGKLPNINYEIPPRAGSRLLTDYIAEKIAVPGDIATNANAVAALHIDSNGVVSNARVVKNISSAVDDNILSAIKSLPAIKPARANGHNVPVDLVISVRFGKVRGDDTKIQAICYALSPATLRDPSNNDLVFVAVQTAPSFPGGTTAFTEFLKKNIVYPPTAKAKHIQGMVFLTFVIRKDGTVTDLMILRSPDDELSEEALRVMHQCPAFTPGMQNGNAVNCSYTVPIGFKL